MLSLPRSLLVGASSRNAGKTLLATALIRQLVAQGPVAALKVTTLESERTTCPHGSLGCGGCDLFTDRFCLLEEPGLQPHKDTARLLQAGARPVYWLRSQEAALPEALQAFLRLVPPEVPLVIESTSLRKVLIPGFFLLTHRLGVPVAKPSAQAVWSLADAHLHFDGQDFSPSLPVLTWQSGQLHVNIRSAASRDLTAFRAPGDTEASENREEV